jgi:hypothetical protein
MSIIPTIGRRGRFLRCAERYCAACTRPSRQMQLGHRVARDVAVAFDQMFVEMLDREAAVNVTIQAQHSLNLSYRGAAQRRRRPPIGQTRHSSRAMAIAPTTEASFTDPKQFRSLDLAQLGPFGTVQNILKAHPSYPLVNACPIHRKPRCRRSR